MLRLLTVVPVLAMVAILLGCLTFFSGCYTLKQGVTMLGYLNRAVPLESLLTASPDEPVDPAKEEAAGSSDEHTALDKRRFVEQVLDIRRFAITELGLRESTNYTRYVALDRDYLAAVVSAAAQDSFSRYEWWFPVVGKVPYKGFFDPKDARKEAEKLKKKDLDVWIRGVDAFSTLGWFSDPLYSYMRRYPVHQLADLIIHEQLHATVYLKGQSQFDEELAEFVGREGSRIYMEKTFGLDSEEYRHMLDSEADSVAYRVFIQELIAELETLYAKELHKEEKLQQKTAIIRVAQTRFDADYERMFHSDNYRGFSRLAVNNAYLELFRLYYAGGAYLEDLYDRSGRNLPVFIAAAKTLKSRRGGTPRQQLEAALGLE
ncbi:MAG: aminopeptidase [Treponema sp.]|jgi:predicted aminopeptidase|nr:aminopeptidase [Treponema sp.]